MRTWPKAMDQWKPAIFGTATRFGFPPSWLAAIMALESGGNPTLCSGAGACGLMQVMPATATALAKRPVTGPELMSDPLLSIELGAKYIRKSLDLASIDGDFVMAAIAYNAGSVRCGTGHTRTDKIPCPTTWNVIMDCATKSDGTVVASDYPRVAIGYCNTAIDRGFGLGDAATPILVARFTSSPSVSLGAVVAVGAGVLLGWSATKKYRNKIL